MMELSFIAAAVSHMQSVSIRPYSTCRTQYAYGSNFWKWTLPCPRMHRRGDVASSYFSTVFQTMPLMHGFFIRTCGAILLITTTSGCMMEQDSSEKKIKTAAGKSRRCRILRLFSPGILDCSCAGHMAGTGTPDTGQVCGRTSCPEWAGRLRAGTAPGGLAR